MNAGDKDTYLTLEGPCEGLFKAKGSKHFGYGFPVHSEAEVKGHLEAIQKSHHAARHVAYAWMIGFTGDHFRSSDDGEPSNSAGPPILGVIRSHELTNVMFAVVRYFGGVKLGVGGLIEAYREGAADALAHGHIVERIRTQRVRVAFAYEHMGVVMGLLKRSGLSPVTTDFNMTCSLDVDVRLNDLDAFKHAVAQTRVAAAKDV
ncbi:MAG: YigZ family protein [Crocinitomicaceae bacterium]|nr:YigZ family protein [Crocinitomicaceae bacterium]